VGKKSSGEGKRTTLQIEPEEKRATAIRFGVPDTSSLAFGTGLLGLKGLRRN